jgi:A/G-specific adenine glycosylase
VNQTDFSAVLLDWYAQHSRDLPWRNRPPLPGGGVSNNPDPYRVWVSEIMLQQTRVETVVPYFERWMARFPDIASLAAASQQDVLSSWEGLGYYSRARNLHQTAKIVAAEMGGALPSDPKELRKLPGIGHYTAGAIASIAFGIDAPALDGNIRRVLARAFNISEPLRTPASERRLWELAAAHLPHARAGEYNQALMDLGATICTPKNPDCPSCPLAGMCQAYAQGLQDQRPVVKARPEIPHHVVTAAVIIRGEQVLITQRPAKGLLGGLWEFPGGKQQPGEDLVACLQREINEELGVKIEVGSQLGVYRHAYTHFRVTLHAFCCALSNGDLPQSIQVDDLRWVSPDDLPDYPMGKIDRQISRDLLLKELLAC